MRAHRVDGREAAVTEAETKLRQREADESRDWREAREALVKAEQATEKRLQAEIELHLTHNGGPLTAVSDGRGGRVWSREHGAAAS